MKPTHLNNNNLPHSPALTRLLKRPVSLFALLTLALVTGLTACSPDTTTTSGRDRANTCSTDCSADGKVCRAGKCVTPSGPITCSATQTPCGSGTQQTCCESNQTCSSNGQCVPKQQGDGTCASPCPDTETCSNGQCVPKQQGDGTCASPCPDTETCSNGQCVPKQQGDGTCASPCADTETCSNGQCVPKQQGDGVECKPACKGAEACVSGQCVDKSGSDKCDPVCEGASTCQDGRCIKYKPPTCEEGCTDDQTCKFGLCSDNDGCPNCDAPNQVCSEGSCQTIEDCAPDASCSTNTDSEVCVLAACYRKCIDGCEDGEVCDGKTGICEGDATPHCVGVTCSGGELCQSECKTVGGCTEDSGICVANPGTTCAALDNSAEVLKLTYGQEMTLYGDFSLNKATGQVSNCAYNGTGSVHHSVKFVVEKPTKLDIEKKDGKFSYALYKGCSDTEEMVCTKNTGITEKLLLPGTYYLTLQTETPEIKWKLRLSATSFEPECEKFNQYYCKGNTLEYCNLSYNQPPNYTKKHTIGTCPTNISECIDATEAASAQCRGASCEVPIVLTPNNGENIYSIQGTPDVFNDTKGTRDASCSTSEPRRGKSITLELNGLSSGSTITFKYDSNETSLPLVMLQETSCGNAYSCLATNAARISETSTEKTYEYELLKDTPQLFMTIVRNFYATNPPLNYSVIINKK